MNPDLDRALADVEQALTGWRMGKVILEDDDSLFKIPHPRVQAWLRALAAAVRDLQAERDALREQVAEHEEAVLREDRLFEEAATRIADLSQRLATAEARERRLIDLLHEIARADHHRAGDFGMLEDVRLRGATWLKIQEAIR